MKSLFIPVALVLLLFCKKNEPENLEIEGVWQAIGYGRILTIDIDSFAFYDTTSISCLPLQEGNSASFGNKLTLVNDTLVERKGTGVYKYIRLEKLPNLCIEPLSESKRNNPVLNFEVYGEAIKDNFAYFKENQIDWDSLYSIHREKISNSTTEVGLYFAMEDIMEALQDNHGYVEPSDKVYELLSALESEKNLENNESVPPEYGDFQMAQLVSDTFLEEDMTTDSPLISWGKLKGNMGYIHVKSMWLYADLNLPDSLVQKNGYISTYVDAFSKMNEGEYIEKERQGVAKIMNRVMEDLSSADSLIVDVRFNGGGQDMVSMEILKRFNDKKRMVATKKTKTLDGFTPEIPIWLEAVDESYTKPVFILTSQQTASAADFFALASMQLPSILRIGSHSQGALSDALEKSLPNGWSFAISNEMYFDLEGYCYESKGIPVHYKLNYPEDRQTFFRSVAQNLEKDKETILMAIKKDKH